jgi:hypothetical protein
MNLQLLKDIRLQWLQAAYIYYIDTNKESALTDSQWDNYTNILISKRNKFPKCPILSDSSYSGGSLYWVTASKFTEALQLYT